MKSHVVFRSSVCWTLKPWPRAVDNPAKFRWAVYKDGVMVGGARTKEKALYLVKNGWWDS